MRDEILEYLKDKCCELANTHDYIVYLTAQIKQLSKKIVDGESASWCARKISEYYADYEKSANKYATLYCAAHQLACRIGLKAEFEKMLQEYLDA